MENVKTEYCLEYKFRIYTLVSGRVQIGRLQYFAIFWQQVSSPRNLDTFEMPKFAMELWLREGWRYQIG